jgi:predicted amidophosphoribosyltransferase
MCDVTVDKHAQLCAECWRHIHFLSAPLCQCCGYPFEFAIEGLCGDCLRDMPDYDSHRAVFRYDEHSKKLIHDLKYHDQPAMLPLMAEWLENTINRLCSLRH